MTTRIRCFVLVIVLTALQACAIRVPQVEATLTQINRWTDPDEEVRQAVWLASFNGQGAVLTPYITDGYTVFANESGDAVAFDGWVVRSVLGFGIQGTLTVSDIGWDRTSESSTAGFTATCKDWQREDLSKGYQWRQICGINGHETVIHIDEAGSISKIKQTFGGDLGTLTLDLRR